jgi:hypothetical protein
MGLFQPRAHIALMTGKFDSAFAFPDFQDCVGYSPPVCKPLRTDRHKSRVRIFAPHPPRCLDEIANAFVALKTADEQEGPFFAARHGS